MIGLLFLLMSGNFVYLSSSIRGGNEKGSEWHKSGSRENKINSFRDFISSAEFLIAEGYTHPSLLCAFGSSAGGLLVGKTRFNDSKIRWLCKYETRFIQSCSIERPIFG